MVKNTILNFGFTVDSETRFKVLYIVKTDRNTCNKTVLEKLSVPYGIPHKHPEIKDYMNTHYGTLVDTGEVELVNENYYHIQIYQLEKILSELSKTGNTALCYIAFLDNQLKAYKYYLQFLQESCN